MRDGGIALEPDNPASIPEANITIQEPEETQESSLHAMMKAWMTFALANVAGIILHISALAAIVVLWLVWKNKRVVHLLPSEPDKRLGAPHGASQSRPVNYCMQDSRGPNSIGRRQMRQHMRSARRAAIWLRCRPRPARASASACSGESAALQPRKPSSCPDLLPPGPYPPR